MFRCIVAGTDGSRTAHLAVCRAVELARLWRARLHVVNGLRSTVSAAATTLETAGLATIAVELEADAQEELRVSLEQLATGLRTEGLDVRVHCLGGEPADAIVGVAERVGADLIVVGNRGMHRRLMGSIPNTVSHRAPCSVLILQTG